MAGRLLIRVTHGARTPDSSVGEASIPANARKVLVPKTIRWSSPYTEAVVEELGPLLAAVAAPIARLFVGAAAVEAREDVEGVGRGHVVLLEA